MSQDFTKLRRAVEMEGALFGMVMAEGSQLVGHAAPFPKSKAVSIIETLRTMQSGHGNEEDLQVVSIGFGEQNLLAVFRNDLLVVALHPSVDDTDAFIHVLVSSLNPDTARSDDEPEFDPMMNTSSIKIKAPRGFRRVDPLEETERMSAVGESADGGEEREMKDEMPTFSIQLQPLEVASAVAVDLKWTDLRAQLCQQVSKVMSSSQTARMIDREVEKMGLNPELPLTTEQARLVAGKIIERVPNKKKQEELWAGLTIFSYN